MRERYGGGVLDVRCSVCDHKEVVLMGGLV